MAFSSSRAQFLVVALMLAFSVMSYFDRSIMSIAGPEIMKEFDIAPTQMGTVYSAFVLSYALFMIPGGYMVDLLGPRMALALMGLGSALFTGLTAFGAKPGLGSYLGVIPALVIVRFVFGVLTAPLYPACGRMSANWVGPIHLARVQGLIIAGSSLGGAISPMLFKGLTGRFGWRMSFAIAAIATALLALFWLLTVRDQPAATLRSVEHHPVPEANNSSWRRLLMNRNLLLLTAAYSALGYFMYIFYYWTYYYFGQVRHMGYEQSARFTTVVYLINAVMTPLGGWISDQLTRAYGEQVGRRAVPIAGLTLSAVLLCAGTLSSGTWTTVTMIALAMGFGSFCEGPFWALAIKLGREQVGAACSILNTGANLAGVIAPILTPFIATWYGWSWALYFGCFIVLLGAIACARVDLRPARILAPQ